MTNEEAGVAVRGRLALAVLVSLFLVGPLSSVAQSTEESHLSEATTTSVPATGGDILLDSLAGFQAGPGQAKIEPGTSNEETISYNGVGTNPSRLFGVVRENPLDHAAGVLVEPVAEDQSPSANDDAEEAASNLQESGGNKSGSSNAPDPDGALESGGSDESGSSDGEDGSGSSADASAIPHPCIIIEDETGRDVCGSVNLAPVPQACKDVYKYIDYIAGQIVWCIGALADQFGVCEYGGDMVACLESVIGDLPPISTDPCAASPRDPTYVLCELDQEEIDSEAGVDLILDTVAQNDLQSAVHCWAVAKAIESGPGGDDKALQGDGSTNCDGNASKVNVKVRLQMRTRPGVWKNIGTVGTNAKLNSDTSGDGRAYGPCNRNTYFRTKAWGTWTDAWGEHATEVDKGSKYEVICFLPKI